MSDFILPAGTVVKYGSISTQLYPILRNGIQPGSARQALKTEGGPAIRDGIYVGELMSYFAACSAFCSATSELHSQNEATMEAFVKTLQNAHGQKPSMPELEAIAVQAGIPVVLEIELGEACTVWADENFIEGTGRHEAATIEESVLRSKAEKSWGNWRCGVIVRDGGIPAGWIRKFHFPRLLDYRDVSGAKNSRMLEQTTDCALMVGGLMQSWHKDAPADLLAAFRKQYGRSDFSQSAGFNE
ncbi:hypothetical protein, partial [Undibacterium sp.]|uniref:hypothetical protein n=1 Tax=Undibacterium sp. TaxID=1914977 RepID=UPI002C2D8328